MDLHDATPPPFGSSPVCTPTARGRTADTARHAAVLYLSGPMGGLPNFNHPAFNAAAARLRAAGYRVLNPVSIEAQNPSGAPQAWEWYMERSLAMLARADAVALLDGSCRSRGVLRERATARSLSMPVLLVEQWLHAPHPAAAQSDVVCAA